MIEARVVLASRPKSKNNSKLIVTWELEYPTWVHNELMTHRAFSRNSSSHRATPVREVLRRVIRHPAEPLEWGRNQRGMQAPRQLGPVARFIARRLWLAARWPAVAVVYLLSLLGLAKQAANRLLAPWAHTRTVLTATDMDNFWALRCHPDAQPEMHRLAEAMYASLAKCVAAGEVQKLRNNEWHLPYVREYLERVGIGEKKELLAGDPRRLRVSAALCARVSVLKPETGKPATVQENLDLYDRLMGGDPKHASPAEHQATPHARENYRSGNLTGWVQYRQIVPGNATATFDPAKAQWTRWALDQFAAVPGLSHLARGTPEEVTADPVGQTVKLSDEEVIEISRCPGDAASPLAAAPHAYTMTSTATRWTAKTTTWGIV